MTSRCTHAEKPTTAGGIAVCNMPGTNSRAVAEMTLALMLAVLRRLPGLNSATRRGAGWALDPAIQGDWVKSAHAR